MATVLCPTCRAPVAWSSANHYRPFCSERCKLIDLGAWAADRYAIAGQPDDDTDEPGDTAAAS